MKIYHCVISLTILLQCNKNGFCKDKNDETNLSRNKRYLMFPRGGGTNIIQLIIGVGIPVEVSPESVIFGWGIRAVYGLPANISSLQYSDYGSSRKKRHVSRWDIYKMLEHEATSRGYEGKSCVLRSICKAAETPLDKDHGLFEELFHSIFTPTSTNEDIDHHTDNQYFAAQALGRKNGGKCHQFFPECDASLMDMFTHPLSDTDNIFA